MPNRNYEKDTFYHWYSCLKERLDAGARISLKVATDSMRPFINSEDRIVVEGVRTKSLKMGDIIIFRCEGSLLAHRFLGETKQGGQLKLVTKADSAWIADEALSSGQLLGRIICIEKGSRTVGLKHMNWRLVNSLLGVISLLRWSICRALRRVK